MKDGFESSCKGNYYRTTLHSLNSTVVKCSKLTKATTVYRGSARGVVPSSFWEADKDGVRGGVEAGFMSTSHSREVAIGYASTGNTPMVFEMAQGMINRGAELTWLSQYPHEEEGDAHQPSIRHLCLPCTLPSAHVPTPHCLLTHVCPTTHLAQSSSLLSPVLR
jgi:hypothetical protein